MKCKNYRKYFLYIWLHSLFCVRDEINGWGKKQLLLIWCHNVLFSINCITFPVLNEWVNQMPKVVLQDVKSSLIILRHLNKQYQAVTSHALASPQPFSSFIWKPTPRIFNVGMLVTVRISKYIHTSERIFPLSNSWYFYCIRLSLGGHINNHFMLCSIQCLWSHCYVI